MHPLRRLIRRWPASITAGLLVLSACSAASSGSPQPLLSPSAVVTPTPGASSTGTPEPTPAPTLVVGQIVQVRAEGLSLRTAAGTEAGVVRVLERGEFVRAVSSPSMNGGMAWYQVVAIDSATGWLPAGEPARPSLVDPLAAVSTTRWLSLALSCPIPPPQVRPMVTITGSGHVIMPRGSGAPGQWSIRQLSPAGLEQVRQEVIDAPLLQAGASYPLQLLPDAGVLVGACSAYTFSIGSDSDAVIVTSSPWMGDDAEAQSAVPSPERKELDRLARLLGSLQDWLGSDAWADEAWPYAADSYLMRVVKNAFPAPDGTPYGVGVAWPFTVPIEAFGEPIDETNRCGDLGLEEAFEMVRLLRGLGIDARLEVTNDHIDLVSGTGWITAALWPQAPDGIPNCEDQTPSD